MRNRNKILDLIETMEVELNRLYARITEDFNPESELQLRM